MEALAHCTIKEDSTLLSETVVQGILSQGELVFTEAEGAIGVQTTAAATCWQ